MMPENFPGPPDNTGPMDNEVSETAEATPVLPFFDNEDSREVQAGLPDDSFNPDVADFKAEH